MLISLNWIRDYVELPADLDPVALAEVFTRTTAEVDGVHRLDVAARGLIAAGVKTISPPLGSSHLRQAVLDVGGKQVETVTAAPKLNVGDKVIYAPPGASVKSAGEIKISTVAGRQSTGMILAADSVGIEMGGQEAVFLSDEFKPGDTLPGDLFDDWLIEIDNKSLTNRPDLWGHFGIAREIAAIVSCGLQSARPNVPPPLPRGDEGGSISILIADANACRRFSAITLEGVGVQPAPLWMQLRLGHVGQRPISGLVDLTNYIMQDLGQPMHAFDADKVRQIEVDWAGEGEKFKTLDGVERVLSKTDLMIKSKGKSVGLAGVMGGLETEVSSTTRSLLLESANFNGATIRRTASRLGLRTDASARFEKSLDPANTVLAIERFVQLAGAMFPTMKIVSRGDAYPAPAKPSLVSVNPRHAARTIGREVGIEEARNLLAPLGFEMSQAGANWDVSVPSFRATGDISIEADVIEELARRIGYDNIAPAMPHTTARTFAVNAIHELEQQSLRYFSTAHDFHEIHGYLWYDDAWLSQLGYDPGPTPRLRNPAGQNLSRLRASLLPGLLASLAKNRFHFDSVSLLELGSVFRHQRRDREGAGPASEVIKFPKGPLDVEYCHLGLILAQRRKNVEANLNDQLRSAISGWAWQRFGRPASFLNAPPNSSYPWEQSHRTAVVSVDGTPAGRLGVIDLALRRKMDEHLGAWGVVWAELHLTQMAALSPQAEKLGVIPPFPTVEIDFTLAVPRTARYAGVADHLGKLHHPLLRSIRFVTAYEDEKSGKRSLTFRCSLGDDHRTLSESDTTAFRNSFEEFAKQTGFEIKKA